MAVIACQRAGVAAVAAMGTALTEDQTLRRLHPEPTLCFDGDVAGRRAAWRTLDRAPPLQQPGRSFRFCAPMAAKDSDEVLREQAAAALKAQLNATRSFVVELFEREKAAEPLDTPERRAGLKVRLEQLAARIKAGSSRRSTDVTFLTASMAWAGQRIRGRGRGGDFASRATGRSGPLGRRRG